MKLPTHRRFRYTEGHMRSYTAHSGKIVVVTRQIERAPDDPDDMFKIIDPVDDWTGLAWASELERIVPE